MDATIALQKFVGDALLAFLYRHRQEGVKYALITIAFSTRILFALHVKETIF